VIAAASYSPLVIAEVHLSTGTTNLVRVLRRRGSMNSPLHWQGGQAPWCGPPVPSRISERTRRVGGDECRPSPVVWSRRVRDDGASACRGSKVVETIVRPRWGKLSDCTSVPGGPSMTWSSPRPQPGHFLGWNAPSQRARLGRHRPVRPRARSTPQSLSDPCQAREAARWRPARTAPRSASPGRPAPPHSKLRR
jgi:hypothetical protein